MHGAGFKGNCSTQLHKSWVVQQTAIVRLDITPYRLAFPSHTLFDSLAKLATREYPISSRGHTLLLLFSWH